MPFDALPGSPEWKREIKSGFIDYYAKYHITDQQVKDLSIEARAIDAEQYPYNAAALEGGYNCNAATGTLLGFIGEPWPKDFGRFEHWGSETTIPIK